jgi:hypothetical protein
MYPTYLEFLNKPAEQEFFTKFLGIYSRDPNGHAVAINLYPRKQKVIQKIKVALYCDKILIGETLESAVKRSLQNDFGLTLIDFDFIPILTDRAKNKLGKYLSRFQVIAYVDYKDVEGKTVVGCNVG